MVQIIKNVFMNLKRIADNRYAYFEQVEDGKFKNAMLGAAMGASLLGGMASCGEDPLEDEPEQGAIQDVPDEDVPSNTYDATEDLNDQPAQETQAAVTPIKISHERQGVYRFKESGKYAEEANALGKELKKRYPNKVTEYVTNPRSYVIETGADGTSEDMIREIANELGIEFELI